MTLWCSSHRVLLSGLSLAKVGRAHRDACIGQHREGARALALALNPKARIFQELGQPLFSPQTAHLHCRIKGVLASFPPATHSGNDPCMQAEAHNPFFCQQRAILPRENKPCQPHKHFLLCPQSPGFLEFNSEVGQSSGFGEGVPCGWKNQILCVFPIPCFPCHGLCLLGSRRMVGLGSKRWGCLPAAQASQPGCSILF